MGIFDRIFGSRRGGESGPRDEAYYYYVRCNKCREIIRVRVDPANDLAQDFEAAGDNPSGYVANKGIVGKKCFRVINISLSFDSRRRESSRSIDGGEFVTREDFEAAGA